MSDGAGMIKSAEDIPAAVAWAGEHPKARWYVARMARAFRRTDLIPDDWEGTELPVQEQQLTSEEDAAKSAEVDKAVRTFDEVVDGLSAGTLTASAAEESVAALVSWASNTPAFGEVLEALTASADLHVMMDTLPSEQMDALLAAGKVTRKVRTQAGVKRYGVPIGTPIVKDPRTGKLKADTSKVPDAEEQKAAAEEAAGKHFTRGGLKTQAERFAVEREMREYTTKNVLTSAKSLKPGDEILDRNGAPFIIEDVVTEGDMVRMTLMDADGNMKKFTVPATSRTKVVRGGNETPTDEPASDPKEIKQRRLDDTEAIKSEADQLDAEAVAENRKDKASQARELRDRAKRSESGGSTYKPLKPQGIKVPKAAPDKAISRGPASTEVHFRRADGSKATGQFWSLADGGRDAFVIPDGETRPVRVTVGADGKTITEGKLDAKGGGQRMTDTALMDALMPNRNADTPMMLGDDPEQPAPDVERDSETVDTPELPASEPSTPETPADAPEPEPEPEGPTEFWAQKLAEARDKYRVADDAYVAAMNEASRKTRYAMDAQSSEGIAAREKEAKAERARAEADIALATLERESIGDAAYDSRIRYARSTIERTDETLSRLKEEKAKKSFEERSKALQDEHFAAKAEFSRASTLRKSLADTDADPVTQARARLSALEAKGRVGRTIAAWDQFQYENKKITAAEYDAKRAAWTRANTTFQEALADARQELAAAEEAERGWQRDDIDKTPEAPTAAEVVDASETPGDNAPSAPEVPEDAPKPVETPATTGPKARAKHIADTQALRDEAQAIIDRLDEIGRTISEESPEFDDVVSGVIRDLEALLPRAEELKSQRKYATVKPGSMGKEFEDDDAISTIERGVQRAKGKTTDRESRRRSESADRERKAGAEDLARIREDLKQRTAEAREAQSKADETTEDGLKSRIRAFELVEEMADLRGLELDAKVRSGQFHSKEHVASLKDQYAQTRDKARGAREAAEAKLAQLGENAPASTPEPTPEPTSEQIEYEKAKKAAEVAREKAAKEQARLDAEVNRQFPGMVDGGPAPDRAIANTPLFTRSGKRGRGMTDGDIRRGVEATRRAEKAQGALKRAEYEARQLAPQTDHDPDRDRDLSVIRASESYPKYRDSFTGTRPADWEADYNSAKKEARKHGDANTRAAQRARMNLAMLTAVGEDYGRLRNGRMVRGADRMKMTLLPESERASTPTKAASGKKAATPAPQPKTAERTPEQDFQFARDAFRLASSKAEGYPEDEVTPESTQARLDALEAQSRMFKAMAARDAAERDNGSLNQAEYDSRKETLDRLIGRNETAIEQAKRNLSEAGKPDRQTQDTFDDEADVPVRSRATVARHMPRGDRQRSELDILFGDQVVDGKNNSEDAVIGGYVHRDGSLRVHDVKRAIATIDDAIEAAEENLKQTVSREDRKLYQDRIRALKAIRAGVEADVQKRREDTPEARAAVRAARMREREEAAQRRKEERAAADAAPMDAPESWDFDALEGIVKLSKANRASKLANFSDEDLTKLRDALRNETLRFQGRAMWQIAAMKRYDSAIRNVQDILDGRETARKNADVIERPTDSEGKPLRVFGEGGEGLRRRKRGEKYKDENGELQTAKGGEEYYELRDSDMIYRIGRGYQQWAVIRRNSDGTVTIVASDENADRASNLRFDANGNLVGRNRTTRTIDPRELTLGTSVGRWRDETENLKRARRGQPLVDKNRKEIDEETEYRTTSEGFDGTTGKVTAQDMDQVYLENSDGTGVWVDASTLVRADKPQRSGGSRTPTRTESEPPASRLTDQQRKDIDEYYSYSDKADEASYRNDEAGDAEYSALAQEALERAGGQAALDIYIEEGMAEDARREAARRDSLTQDERDAEDLTRYETNLKSANTQFDYWKKQMFGGDTSARPRVQKLMGEIRELRESIDAIKNRKPAEVEAEPETVPDIPSIADLEKLEAEYRRIQADDTASDHLLPKARQAYNKAARARSKATGEPVRPMGSTRTRPTVEPGKVVHNSGVPSAPEPVRDRLNDETRPTPFSVVKMARDNGWEVENQRDEYGEVQTTILRKDGRIIRIEYGSSRYSQNNRMARADISTMTDLGTVDRELSSITTPAVLEDWIVSPGEVQPTPSARERRQRRLGARENQSSVPVTPEPASDAASAAEAPEREYALDQALEGKKDSKGNQVATGATYKLGRGYQEWRVASVNRNGTVNLEPANGSPLGNARNRKNVATNRLIPAAEARNSTTPIAATQSTATEAKADTLGDLKDASGAALTTESRYTLGRGYQRWKVDSVNPDGTVNLVPTGGGDVTRKRWNVDPKRLKPAESGDTAPAATATREDRVARIAARETAPPPAPVEPAPAEPTPEPLPDLTNMTEDELLAEAERAVAIGTDTGDWTRLDNVDAESERRRAAASVSKPAPSATKTATQPTTAVQPPKGMSQRVYRILIRTDEVELAGLQAKITAGTATADDRTNAARIEQQLAELRGEMSRFYPEAGNISIPAPVEPTPTPEPPKAKAASRPRARKGRLTRINDDWTALDDDYLGELISAAEEEERTGGLSGFNPGDLEAMRRERDVRAQENSELEQIEALIRAGSTPAEAEAEVTGQSVDSILRRDAVQYLRDTYRISTRVDGNRFEELLTAAYEEELQLEMGRAEVGAEWQWYSNTPEGRRMEARDPRELWKMRRDIAEKAASQELRKYWDQNGRLTKSEFRRRVLDAVGARPGSTYRGEDFLR